MQRRLHVTPTLMLFSKMQDEESNRVIRKFKDYLPNFIRLSFVADDLSKGFYMGEKSGLLLGYIH
jgi:hypothetical protein